MRQERSQVTQLLLEWRDGRKEALAELTPIIYRELHRLAGACLRGQRPDHPLQPTALINEAYLRLLGNDLPEWQNRAHFVATAAQIMRQVLVDFARKKRAVKRDFGHQVALDNLISESGNGPEEVIALNDSLDRLAALNPRRAKAIELRYFGGLSIEETAEALGLTVPTVRRDVALGQTWLREDLTRKAPAS